MNSAQEHFSIGCLLCRHAVAADKNASPELDTSELEIEFNFNAPLRPIITAALSKPDTSQARKPTRSGKVTTFDSSPKLTDIVFKSNILLFVLAQFYSVLFSDYF